MGDYLIALAEEIGEDLDTDESFARVYAHFTRRAAEFNRRYAAGDPVAVAQVNDSMQRRRNAERSAE